MAVADMPLRIAQLSDIHVGGPLSFKRDEVQTVIDRVNALRADLVVVAGDLTMEGRSWEFDEVAAWLEQIEQPMVVVPGNHDARNVGAVHYRKRWGRGEFRYRMPFDAERAERLGATGFTVVGVDSSEPDVNEGRVGPERYETIRTQFDEPDDIKIFVVHHHIVSIPGTGRERNIVLDAGDLLAMLTRLDIDVVLSGHKHVPFFWGLNGMLIANSGTAASRRIRGICPPSWNEVVIDASTIKVFIHYQDGTRQLAALFSRKTRQLMREAFYLTEEYVETNGVFAGA
jgi:Icc protein